MVDLEDVETDYVSIKALRKAATEFETYIANNASMIPNYAERRWYGERVSTGFVESTVNTVVGKRLGKASANALVKTRCAPHAANPNPGPRWHPTCQVRAMAFGVETCVRNRNSCMSAPHFTVLSNR